MKRAVLLVSSCVALAGLVSCGGGGGDDAVAAPPTAASAEGYYAGNLKVSAFPTVPGDPALPGTATAFQTVILENGQFFTIYGTPNGSSLDVKGFAQGTGTSNGTVFTDAGARNFADPTRAPATNAVAVLRYDAVARSLSGSITDSATTSALTSVPQTSSYNYASPATLASVAGVWNVRGAAGDGYVLAVDSSGTFTGTPTSSLGCSFTGRFVPRPSGKNVLNVTVTNGPAPCTQIGLVSTGVGYVTPVGTGSQLTFASVSANRVFGGVISGVRP